MIGFSSENSPTVTVGELLRQSIEKLLTSKVLNLN